MLNIQKYFFFILNLFIFLYQNIKSNICSPDYSCDKCTQCEGDMNDYSSCNYYNIFCIKSKSWYSIEYNFYTFLKKEYIKFYTADSDINNFCGQNEYTLKSGEQIDIFSSHNKIFTINKYYHCTYLININDEESSLSYKLVRNEDSNEIRYLSFHIMEIINYYNKESEEIVSINHKDLRSKSAEYSLNSVEKIEIFFDFLDKNYSQPEEILEIKLTSKNKKSESSNNDNNNNNESSSGLGGILGGSLGGVLAFVIIGVLIYYCCCRKDNS